MTGSDLVKKRHPEWIEHQLRWRWLADSLEGGDRYRWVSYGADSRGFPIRNLIRHKREYPAPDETYRSSISLAPSVYGFLPEATATDDDYSLRLIRTPVPDFVSEVTRKHLGRVYRHEVKREGPAQYLTWAENVDGAETPLDAWMRTKFAPQLLAIGCIDVVMDHPKVPAGSTVRTRADQQALSLDSVIARIVHPWDVVWWMLDLQGQYDQVLVRETAQDDNDKPVDQYRHWTKTEWTLYDKDGVPIDGAPHPYGIVPQIRVFVGRKHRCEHTGWTPLEAIAERQREYYNRDSELILSDVLQAHPLLQGPPPEADGSISIGPGWLLAKRQHMLGTTVHYEGYDYIDPPKGAADSIRTNLDRLRADVEQSQGLTKPAGGEAAGGAGVVAQSGLSKSYDHADRNDMLDTLADALQAVEVSLGRLATTVATNGSDRGEAVTVAYSRKFDLKSGDEIATSLTTFQDALASAGRAPELETRVLLMIVREDLLPGLDDAEYAEFEAEIRAAVEEASEERKAGVMATMRAAAGVDPMGGDGEPIDEGDDDDSIET